MNPPFDATLSPPTARGRKGCGARKSPPLPNREKPVLMIVHQETSKPGRIGHWLCEAGYQLDIRRPRFGDPLPDCMDGHAGAVLFGGPMSANDSDDFVRREIDWIEVPLREGAPFFGICLGGQMLAKQLGATVRGHRDGIVEVGYENVQPTPEGQRLAPWPERFYQWHVEGFDLPSGAVRLAETAHYPNQAILYGTSAIGVQFHPEITYALINRWTTMAPHRFELPNAQPRRAHILDHHRNTASVGDWLDQVMPLWLHGELGDQIASENYKPETPRSDRVAMAAE